MSFEATGLHGEGYSSGAATPRPSDSRIISCLAWVRAVLFSVRTNQSFDPLLRGLNTVYIFLYKIRVL
jgi:hypothetical protein